MPSIHSIQQKLTNQPIRSICLIKPSAFGDVVQALPVVAFLKQRWPEARITWVISSALKNLLEGYDGIDELIFYERKGKLASWLKLLKELRSRRFDLVFDLQGLLRTGVMTLATRAPTRVGLQTAREYSWLANHGLLEGTERSIPAYQRYLNIANFLELPNASPEWNFGIQSQDRTRALQLIGDLPAPLITIHAGAQWVTKRWPTEHFAKVIHEVAKRLSPIRGSVVLVGAPGEAEINQQLHQQLSSVPEHWPIRDLTGKTSLRELAVILKTARMMLSNDSGPMHLAAAMGTQVTGIFTCTSGKQSGPYGNHHKVFQANVDCTASYKKQCPMPGDQQHCCFDSILPMRVSEVITDSM